VHKHTSVIGAACQVYAYVSTRIVQIPWLRKDKSNSKVDVSHQQTQESSRRKLSFRRMSPDSERNWGTSPQRRTQFMSTRGPVNTANGLSPTEPKLACSFLYSHSSHDLTCACHTSTLFWRHGCAIRSPNSLMDAFKQMILVSHELGLATKAHT
jgi:hypothetical protein